MALLFPKPGKKKKEGPTPAEKYHKACIKAMPCIACRVMGMVNPRRSDPHHIKEGQGLSVKASEFEMIPLCPRHHTIGKKGEAYHEDPKAWPFDQRELLALAWKLLQADGLVPSGAEVGSAYEPPQRRSISSFLPPQ